MFLKSPLWHLGKERQLEGLGKEMKVSKRDLMGAVGLLLKKDLKRLLEKKNSGEILSGSWNALSRQSVVKETEARCDLWLGICHSGAKERSTKKKDLIWASVKAKEWAGGKEETWNCRDTRDINSLEGTAEQTRKRERHKDHQKNKGWWPLKMLTMKSQIKDN